MLDKLQTFLSFELITVADRTLTAGQVLFVPTVLIIVFLLARWLERFIVARMTKNNVNPDAMHLVRRIYIVVVLAILFVTLLDLLQVPLTAFAFVSGAVAIGIGFGAQNIINNFISGWILMWERPIRIGDFLELGDMKGTVEAINTRSTRIRRVDGVHVLTPNSHLLENTVVNWTLVDRLARTVVRVGVAYGSPAKRVAQLLELAADEHTQILQEPPPFVIFEDFGDNALIFDLVYWVHAVGERDLRVIRSDIRFRIDELFGENAITIAYPQRDLHIDTLAPLEVRLVDKE